MLNPRMTNSKKENTRARRPSCCKRTLHAACAALLAMTLGACSDERSETAQAPPPPARSAHPAAHSLAWLRQTDAVSPDHWLASREAGRDLDPYDPKVAEIHRTLETAAQRFRDYPRMIANRAVQLEAMLKKKAIDEHAPSTIATLCEVPGDRQNIESFASLAQQYYNLRLQGLDRSQSIAALRSQSDPRSRR